MINNKTISILGSGWLGFPLAEYLILQGNYVNISTTSEKRIPELALLNAKPFKININSLSNNIQKFLESDILIINIPSKDIDGFIKLLDEIEISQIEKVIFISSTSVYEDCNKTIIESDGMEMQTHPLIVIENIFRNSNKFKTTILRFGGLIGYTRHPGRFFANGSTIANPNSFVNLIHRDDCIGIINQIILQEVWDETFNCCADTHPTKREFYTQVIKSIGFPEPKFVDSSSNSFKIISNSKVKERLNYVFLHPDLMKIDFI
ncbi:MAG: SDR family NAD(P)-dependent oxidoreductase [Bacteroidetes bacterium]|nr:SDR family NAD(P)-dependent oxidoreductase [Bacteroidota bacterium]MBU1116645.1 SDR family NAD(P)-dependent oxidoreductase [Bacteroidota bacterium]MBU1797504.1 SDR family NAD(P)-dependent oxidoreductase [Bacteroidota bacterium]